MAEADVEARLARWEARLKSATTQTLSTDYTRPDPPRTVDAIHSVVLPDKVRLALLQLGIIETEEPATPFSVLLASFAILASRLTGDEDISIGTSNAEHEPFVVRTPLSAKSTFKEVLQQVQKVEAEGGADAVPLHLLVEHIQKKTKTNAIPSLFRLSLYHAPDAPSQEFLNTYQSTTDISIFVELGPVKNYAGLRGATRLRDIQLRAHYNQLIFSQSRISIMIEQLLAIILEASKNPDVPVGSISLLTESQTALVPDPTKNLNWGKFRGPIHDIFSANAKKHPERECVIETADPHVPESVTRTFTYQQIDESSNILAHHFVAKGIKIGDVVMVYAHRGVDLVVAVMGVLKAGATFSVIDPAYPPARQNIYLQVAKPRALVVISKAGALASSVRKYIADELDILTEVPALAIQDDGKLLGGSLDGGEDVLAGFEDKKSQGTGVIVGPDCNPTLSFTSGSEGIPKGVRGRHFSLTYYFPWMSERFGLTENDRFTMLSGIAHDPIQRDMFTPLFLGAKLLVPTANDIGTPGRLAEWMDDNKATITHLTPAMGQLLSAQAERSIPSLHHAFFVGDILTKRDCLRLQNLARNVAVVNMYGTTETQRAVSYFEVPSYNTDSTFSHTQKDVIAAGQGMLDVQLLVVNRNDRNKICGVGEIGEIYVRAAGLAEGYLGLPDMTALKFIKNWFVPEDHWVGKDGAPEDAPWKQYYFGPRDRLYRTGDLGRYTPGGNVECSGRADDQVKIRGFRIELGEIDTHLSQHPLVRENITLVKRDKDEEPTLISYIVPLNKAELDELVSATEAEDGEDEEVKGDPIVRGLRKYRKLIKEVKEYLKKKLPSYAVPTVVVPLPKLPLNPNGKVDKPALPFPDTAQLAAASKKRSSKSKAVGGVEEPAENLTKTQSELKKIWQGLLPHADADITPESNFFELGGHSLLATRMIFDVRKAFVTNFTLTTIYEFPTLGALAAEIDRLHGGDLNLGEFGAEKKEEEQSGESIYEKDAKELAVTRLAKAFPPAALDVEGGVIVFLTGATGFLGVFLLRELFKRSNVKKVIAHVRAASVEKALGRLQASCEAYGVWDSAWLPRLEAVTGELSEERLGLSQETWDRLTKEVNVIIHNGALVHWVHSYQSLRAPNVLGTIATLDLCTEGVPKSYVFVSSTSVVDTDHYVQLSDSVLSAGGAGIPESDDLQGSASGLGNGYGQSKWAAEYLVREAGNRGLSGHIVRPGYIVGDSTSGTTNTDDFLVRMLKGSIQLGKYPNIFNTVNMVPVDHVARVVAASGVNPAPKLVVAHVTSHPRLRMNEFLSALEAYGFGTKAEEYVPWKIALEQHIRDDTNSDNALLPLLHFVLEDLPASTKAPELDDTNTVAAMESDKKWTGEDWTKGAGVSMEDMGTYLAYLVGIGYLPAPSVEGERRLPEIVVDEAAREARAKAGGRGANA